ncbi:MAG: hypothetical protein ACOC0D_07805 [Spirochaeta sp.]
MRRTSNAAFLLQLSLGIMFSVLGIAGLSGATAGASGIIHELDSLFGGSQGVFAVVIAVIQLVAGVLLLLSLFGMIKENITQVLLLLILVLWAIELVLQFVMGGRFLQPNVLTWLGNIAPYMVIFAGILVIYEHRPRRT